MSLPSGSHLGRYEVLGLLGFGGMGEVYRARDTHLHRDVALKILPEAATGEALAEGRFEREARAIASVNHPNICAVYDAGVDGGRRFLVMELLEGEALEQRLRRGAFDVPELLEHAIALADALHAAHAREIIHRDLKPGNIFLTSRGQPKILDFGLAKASDSSDVSTRAAEDLITGKGAAVGTAAYMSPEQIRGDPLDGRTDVFSLGLVLYEMSTGQRAFSGNTGAAVAASILHDEPTRPGDIRAGLPPELAHTIVKALEKDRDLRYQSAADLRADLKRVRKHLFGDAALAGHAAPVSTHPGSGSRQTAATAHPSSSSDTQLLGAILSRHRVWAAAAVLMIIAAAAAWLWLRTRDPAAVAAAFSNLQVQQLTLDGETVLGAISPDGRFIVFVKSGGSVRVRQISEEREIELVPAGRFSRLSSLTVTPDNNFVDVVAVTGAGPLPDAWRIPLLGGNPRQLLRNVVSAIGWSPDARSMAFITSESQSGAMTVVTADADGKNQQDLVTRRPPKMFYGDRATTAGRPPSRPAWSPDGELLVLPGYSADTFVDESELVVLEAKTGAERRIVAMKGVWAEVAWLDDAHLVLAGTQGGSVMSQLWVSDLSGERLTRLTREFGFLGHISLTADRTTAIARRFTRESGIWASSASGADPKVMIPLSPAGAAVPFLDSEGGLTYTAFKGDGGSAVYHLRRGATTPIPIVDLTTLPIGNNFLYDVSPDGSTVVYTQVESPRGLYRMRNDGSERVKLVDEDARHPRLTRDGGTVLFGRRKPGLYSVATRGGEIRQLIDRVIGSQIAVSPDGSRVLFSTEKPGIVALCDLPDCTNLKEQPLRSAAWAPDGAGVAYLQDGTKIMEQPLDGGKPRVLAELAGPEPIINFRWSPDGSRLATSRGRYPNDLVLIKGLR